MMIDAVHADLRRILDALDSHGLSAAAAHLSMAIDALPGQIGTTGETLDELSAFLWPALAAAA
jgi:hypothetical protein